MAINSPERDVVERLVTMAQGLTGFDHGRFDPTAITQLGSLESTEDTRLVFLKRTLTLPILGIGHKTVALFAEEEPAISKETTENIIHRSSDYGVWLRKPTNPELAAARDFNPKHSWVFEMVTPHPDKIDTVIPSGLVSEPYVPRAL
jgi:predicted subunit of tRNA(5-methylaminomethyl-2-thiouridylate) methyltransferase